MSALGVRACVRAWGGGGGRGLGSVTRLNLCCHLVATMKKCSICIKNPET